MSTGLLTNYNAPTNINLSRIFPQYEVQYLQIADAVPYSANPIEYGFFPTYNVSNYFVIPSFFTTVIGNTDNVSNQTFLLVVSNRKPTSFLVTVKINGTILLISGLFIVCLIVYFNSDVTSTSFEFNNVNFIGSGADIATKFPNYTYNNFLTSTSGSKQNNEFYTNFSGKGIYNYGEYNTFASYETDTTSQASTLSEKVGIYRA